MTNVARDRKKSNFTSQSVIPSSAYFDYVLNGTNYRIPVADMIAGFGTTGTISQKGDPTQTPILNVDGTDNQIRNLEDGPGVKSSISALGGAKLEHNFSQGVTGSKIIKDLTSDQTIFRTLVAGAGISVAEQNGYIQIATSETPTTTKTVIINEESDFPTAESGVITLEGDTFYFLTNDISTANRFILGSTTVIGGSDGTLITLTYTGTGTMFSSVDCSNKIKDLICDCSSGTFIDVSCSLGTGVFQITSSRVTCDIIGTIDNMYTSSIQNVIWSALSDGFTFLNNNSIISFFQNIGGIAAGSFIDLGTSTFDGFSFSNSQGMLSAGATFLSGLADSGNVNTGGLATVFNTRASGDGTALSGISETDSLWEFTGNNGIPNSISAILAKNSNVAISIAASNTPVIIGPGWTFSHESRFSGNASGVVTYTGKGAHIKLSATISADLDTGVDDITFYFYKNGVQESDSAIIREFDAGDPGNISMVWQMDVATDDTISIYVENNDSTADIDIINVILGIS